MAKWWRSFVSLNVRHLLWLKIFWKTQLTKARRALSTDSVTLRNQIHGCACLLQARELQVTAVLVFFKPGNYRLLLCLSSSSQGITGYCCACLLQARELQVTTVLVFFKTGNYRLLTSLSLRNQIHGCACLLQARNYRSVTDQYKSSKSDPRLCLSSSVRGLTGYWPV